MAKAINAVHKYRPRIKHQKTVREEELAKFIEGRTSINAGAILNVLYEIREAMIFFHRTGEAVKLQGLGTFTPEISLDGRIKVVHRADRLIKSELNVDYQFKAKILNRDMIGKNIDDLVRRWNDEHPDDPVDDHDKSKGKGKK